MQVFQKQQAVLGGMDEAIAILKLCSDDWDELTVHALYDGDEIAPWETVMTIEGDYTLFAHLETSTSACSRADARLHQRPPRRRGGAGQADPLLPGAARPPPRPDGRRLRAHVAGAIGVSTDAQASWWGGRGIGTVPHALIAAYGGNTVLAATKFAESAPDDMNVVVLVDFENDSVRTSLEVARAMGERLWGVRLDTSRTLVDRSLWDEMGDFDPRGVNERLVRKARALDENGFERVKIVVSGGFDVERIREFEERTSRSTPTASARRSSAATTTSPPTSSSPTASVGEGRAQVPPEPAARARRVEALQLSGAVPMEAAGGLARGLHQRPSGYALTWLPLVFLGLIVYLIWKSLSLMAGAGRPRWSRPRSPR